MKILISGALGFMGREVAALAKKDGIEVACGVDIMPGQADYPLYTTYEQCPDVDVAIDFSTWKPGADLLTWALKHRVPAVIATTGLSEEQLAAIDEAAKVIPIFRSGNMSLGIALLQALAKKAASVLGDSFDIEIVETHHNRKAGAVRYGADAAGGGEERLHGGTRGGLRPQWPRLQAQAAGDRCACPARRNGHG